MFEILRFEPDHIIPLLAEEMNRQYMDWYYTGYAHKLKQNTVCFTGRMNGQVLICAGIAPLWPGRGYIWCVLSEHIRAHSISVYRGARRWLKAQPYNRLEMDVPVDLEIAHRRAEWLGFNLEIKRARKYMPDGGDASVYVWVRE